MISDKRLKESTFFRIIGAIFAFLLFFTSQIHCQTLQGNITRIIDADTVQFRASNGKYCTARLSGIDAPERMQDYGKECSAILKTAVWGKSMTANVLDIDQYKRAIISFSTPTIPDISLFMIQSGCGWEYLAPSNVQSSYESAEATARTNTIGLWINPNPIKPSVWRQMKRLGLL